VLELVPSEIEKLIVPVPRRLRPQLQQLDKLVRNESAHVVLAHQSQRVLGELGVRKPEQEQLIAAWLRLKNRRQRIPEDTDQDCAA
jgi:adenine-specific DNA-methyltransferase